MRIYSSREKIITERITSPQEPKGKYNNNNTNKQYTMTKDQSNQREKYKRSSS
jgi:hypothetical protein